MANYIVSLLDELNRDLSAREAAKNRAFVEQRVDQNLRDLDSAEENLKSFQEKHGVIAVPEDVKTSLSSVAELYGQKTKKELEVSTLRRIFSEDNEQLKTATLQLSEIERKLKEVPELGMESMRLYREYLIQQKIYETLFPILEQTRIEEKKDTPTLLVLDKAVPPERPYWPKKTIIVIVFFFLSLVVSIISVIVMDNVDQMRELQPAQYEKLKKSVAHLVRWSRKN